MGSNYQSEENNKFNPKREQSKDSVTYFDLCPKCSMFQANVRDWMKHLVDRHPLPIEWMSDTANYLNSETIGKPYTTVTESRKKRKKNITPRPLNSFMIFSRHLRRNVLLFFSDASNSEISKLLGKLWNNIPATIKSMYDTEAKKLSILHCKEFPDYKYQPKKKKNSYSTKHSIDNCTSLSNNSNQSEPFKMSYTISNSTKYNSQSRDNDPASVSSSGSFSNNKSNSVINHNIKYTQLAKQETIRKTVKKSSKNSSKIIISSNQILDDSEGAESSPSSFKNTLKNDLASNCSPFISDSHSSLSDFKFSSSLVSLVKNNESCIPYSPKIEDNFLCDSKNNYIINGNNFQHLSDKNANIALNLTTPLTILTDKVGNSNELQPLKVNMRFVKVINKPRIQKYNNMMAIAREGPDKIFISQPNSDLIESKNFRNLSHLITFDPIENFDEINKNAVVPNASVSDQVHHYNDNSDLVMNRKRPNFDPLIIDDSYENDCFENSGLSFDNNSSPWSFKSPNFKFSTTSSSLSENPCKESFCGASSPFLLSENENQLPHPIQRLPAIGSWLRSNCSEFMI